MRAAPAGRDTGRVHPIRVVLVDDNADFLDAAAALLEHQGVRVVGRASSSADALRRVGTLRPDVALVDVELGADSGFDLAEALHGHRAAPVILMSNHAEQDFAELIDASPALGFLPKAGVSAAAISALLDQAVARTLAAADSGIGS